MINKSVRKAGRPFVGVTNRNATEYRKIIYGWINRHELTNWIKEDAWAMQAKNAFMKLDSTSEEFYCCLNIWCNTWLSPVGWKRLQANARQHRYINGTKKETNRGISKNRDYKKNIQIDHITASRLKKYSIINQISMQESIDRLLDIANQMDN